MLALIDAQCVMLISIWTRTRTLMSASTALKASIHYQDQSASDNASRESLALYKITSLPMETVKKIPWKDL